jgi:hypothetical protein
MDVRPVSDAARPGNQLGDIVANLKRPAPAFVKSTIASPPPTPQPAAAAASFTNLWELGYRRVVPIIPFDAAISERSSLASRIGTSQDARGKAVGVRGRDGSWYGFDWLPYEADEQDCARWQGMGAGAGIKTGQGLVGIDADTLDVKSASTIAKAIVRHFGQLPARVGRHPKVLYPIRVSEPLRYCRIEFGELNDKGRLKDRVEILSDGRQFVAHGVHPTTKTPYTWPLPLVPFDELPIVPAASVLAFMEELRTLLPAAKPLITEGATTDVDQASLKGRLEDVRRAVSLIPNTTKNFPTRDSYRDVGYAIKAALPDDQDAAFEIFARWASEWHDGAEHNDPGVVEADWRRMKKPFRRGANWLYELAEQHSPQQFDRASTFFQPITDEPDNPFGTPPAAAAETAFSLEPTLYTFPDPAGIPLRQWVYGDHYIRGFVSATVAPGGLGKSSLTIAEALAMASGRPLLGVEPRGQFRVWLWNGEDPRDELDRRIAAAMRHYGLTAADIGDRLLVDSGMEQEIVLAKETRNGATIVEPMADALVSALRRKRIDVFVADPFVSSHKVTENDNVSIDLVVKRWGKIAFTTGTSIELVHHVRKTNGNEVTVEDARGASALVNGTRVTRALTRMTDVEGRSLGVDKPWLYFRSGGVAKNNLAPAAGAPAAKADWFTLTSEQLGNGKGSGVDALMTGDAVGVVIRAQLATMAVAHDPGEVETAFRLIGEGEWRADVRAGDAWVGIPVAKAFGLDAGDKDDRTKINGILRNWRHERRIHDVTMPDKSRHNRQFVRVCAAAAKVQTPASTYGVFG